MEAPFSVDSLIKAELPPLPGNVVRISAMLSNMSVSQTAIAKAVSLDAVFASRILRLANSASYAQGTEVTNLTQAVTSVGNQAISEMLLIGGIGDSIGGKVLNSPAGKDIWVHLLLTALAASDMCHLARIDGADTAFTAGLLHDIGKLILLRADAPTYTVMLQHATAVGDLAGLEREAYGFDHTEVGSLAAEKWKLPCAIKDIIRSHHGPAENSASDSTLNIVRLADTFVYRKKEDQVLDDLLVLEVAPGFGFNNGQFEAIWEDLLIRLEDVSYAFN